jgi:hypothetical protein
VSLNLTSVTFGPRYRFRLRRLWSAYGQVLIGKGTGSNGLFLYVCGVGA